MRAPPEPMYATIGRSMPRGRGWTFEQKYDGMRVVALVRGREVGLFTRNGRDKAAQFPEVVDALRRLSGRTRRSLILDGEIVAIVRGTPASFQALQSRMQLKDLDLVREKAAADPAALVLFDTLQDGSESLLRLPWHARRKRLERLLASNGGSLLLSASSSDGARMIARARRRGWEGVIAKQVDSTYVPGARSTAWLKLKLQHRAEFVVGGYTEPRRSRAHIGALLLGYFDRDGRLCHVGHMGGGFNRESLEAMLKRLKPLERRTSPFADRVVTNEPAHWVRPTVVVEAKFAEWTADGKLRQPIFLGVRDDKNARDVHREQESIQEWAQEIGGDVKQSAGRSPTARAAKRKRPSKAAAPSGPAGAIVRQLDDIQASGGDGTLQFGRGKSLHVSSLDKPYFPADGITKGDIMRYYALLSSVLLPIIKDRPLILKRYPNGVDGQSFFQQNAGDHIPDGVRTASVKMEGGDWADRIIGGDLLTLLYTVQIGTIAVHTWQSRIQSPDHADSATIDLDPADDLPFSEVVSLARDIKAELDKLTLHAAIKTSGSSGLHIAIPLPAKTTFEESAALAEIISTRVVEKRPRLATVERSVKSRPKQSIYVDAQQNAAGKSVVAAYSVRERSGATVSAPLDWRELGKPLRLDAFTVDTMPSRMSKLGDMWGVAMKRRNTKRAIERVLREV